jgi:hypothetical protein
MNNNIGERCVSLSILFIFALGEWSQKQYTIIILSWRYSCEKIIIWNFPNIGARILKFTCHIVQSELHFLVVVGCIFIPISPLTNLLRSMLIAFRIFPCSSLITFWQTVRVRLVYMQRAKLSVAVLMCKRSNGYWDHVKSY